jgi:hypothetical protein
MSPKVMLLQGEPAGWSDVLTRNGGARVSPGQTAETPGPPGGAPTPFHSQLSEILTSMTTSRELELGGSCRSDAPLLQRLPQSGCGTQGLVAAPPQITQSNTDMEPV